MAGRTGREEILLAPGEIKNRRARIARTFRAWAATDHPSRDLWTRPLLAGRDLLLGLFMDCSRGRTGDRVSSSSKKKGAGQSTNDPAFIHLTCGRRALRLGRGGPGADWYRRPSQW